MEFQRKQRPLPNLLPKDVHSHKVIICRICGCGCMTQVMFQKMFLTYPENWHKKFYVLPDHWEHWQNLVNERIPNESITGENGYWRE